MVKHFLFVLLAFIVMTSCKNQTEQLYIYKEPKIERLDATSEWLRDENNFFKENYNQVLNKFYSQNVAKGNYQKAAKILEIVANKANRFQSFSDDLKFKIDDFNKKYASKIEDEKDLWFVSVFCGQYYANKGQFEKAIESFKQLEQVQVTDYESCYFKASNWMRIAWCNFNLGQQDLAIEYNLKALELLKQTDQKDILGSVYFYIYPVYLASKDYKNAEINLNKSIAYYNLNSKKNETNLFICLYNKIELLEELNRKEERKKLIDSVLVAFKKREIKDPSMKVSLFLLDFSSKLDDNKLEEAASVLSEIKSDVLLLNSDYTTADFNKAEALLEIKKNKSIKDPQKIVQAISKFKEENSYQDLINAYNILYQDALWKKEYKKALEFYSLYQNASDSLGNEKMNDKVVELETRYQTQKKEQEIKIQKETISKKNAAIGSLISALIVLFLGAIIYFLKQKQKKLKAEKLQSQKFTKNLLDKTEEERKRIATDLHDSVSHELLNLKSLTEQNHEELNSKIDLIINDIRTISRNLHPVLFDKIGFRSSVENLVERMQNHHDFMISTNIEYTDSLSKENELQLYRIVQETLSNIIKYSNAFAARVNFVESQSKYYLEIIDNGKGFDVEETLLKKDAFGLHNILERSKAIGGSAQISSSEKGTKIVVEIQKK
jgi:two-component system, NarL family, sensor kinase